MKEEDIYFAKYLLVIPVALLVISLPFAVIVPLIWLKRWSESCFKDRYLIPFNPHIKTPCKEPLDRGQSILALFVAN
ncbi:hypothetical protein [Pseudobacillus badius]|uniref:hypothetical protein n=1 Tax=Bacillus badius TaxID=1455 RepID=UPI002556E0CF|nr:hypothetical protein [Bacillus badius]